jgi:hypothetical protein
MRQCGSVSNHAAIKTFFHFFARHEPTMQAACERVCAIRPQKENCIFSNIGPEADMDST